MFTEVVIVEDRQRADALSDALVEAGALSSSVEDADAGAEDETPIYGEPAAGVVPSSWKRSRVTALFDEESIVDAALADALAIAGMPPDTTVERRRVADANWVALTQAQFGPMRVGPRLWVVPSWHEPPSEARDPSAIVLALDPGMAFGTGDHPTTRLCLAWLDECMPRGATLIDYGAGSGILAIAAAKLGASHVVGTDIDEQAVIAARRNAEDNGVDATFEPSTSFASAPVDVVVANILSNPLKVLAPVLARLVAPGGSLVLSGVLERQADDVAAAYAPHLSMAAWRSEGGWVCLAGRRPQER